MTSERTRVLVVSDDDARGQAMAKCIERGDSAAEVRLCTTHELLQRIDAEHPRVVLLAGDGDIVRMLRGHAPDLPIVAVVLSDTEDAAEGGRALDEGATDVMTTSELQPRMLAWRLRLAIRHHEAEQRMREAKELAESASARKTEFLSSMSHEIRTPLNTMVGMAELLEETQLDDRQRRYTSTLQRASDHILALIENVLDLARIEAGTVTIEDCGFDLFEVVESAVDMVRVQARRKKLDIGWTAADNVPRELKGDPRRIRQVLVNLLGNAIKFTGQGRVWLEVGCDAGGTLHFTVADTGVGIPEDKLEAIFSGFVQVGEDSDRKRGYGLGLSISRRIVERMGGRMWVESTLGKGSVFNFTLKLPIAQGVIASRSFGADEPKTTATTKLRAAGDRRVRVLVVDDSEDNRVLLGEYLRGADVDVDFADDGTSALDKATAQSFDVVLMDLQLPQLDGYATTRELLRRVRERDMKPPAVIALSAHVLAESFGKSMEAGCTTQLTKPIRKRALLDAVAQAAGARAIETSSTGSNKGPIREEILPLLPRFFANRRADVRIIREAAERNDMGAISTLSHNMRGTGASYGFPELSTLGDSISAAGKRGAKGDLINLATELEQLLDRLEPRYAELAAAAAAAAQQKKSASARLRVQSTGEPSGAKH